MCLNDQSRRLLTRYFEFYRSLEDGTRIPATKDQEHFVRVCEGSVTPATDHERAWLALRRLVAESGVDVDELRANDFDISSVRSGHDEIEFDEAEGIPFRPCRGCGQPIPPERLEAIPDADYCCPCQQNEETQPKRDWHETDNQCPRCAEKGIEAQLVWRTARSAEISGYLLGCTRFPQCRYVDRT